MDKIKSIKGRFGKIEIFELSKNHLVAKPKGYISSSMIKDDFHAVKSFDSKSFEYYVDLTDSVIPNPINLIYLRKLKGLKNLNKYHIITEKPFLIMILKMIKQILKFDSILNKAKFNNLKKQIK